MNSNSGLNMRKYSGVTKNVFKETKTDFKQQKGRYIKMIKDKRKVRGIALEIKDN